MAAEPRRDRVPELVHRHAEENPLQARRQQVEREPQEQRRRFQ
jgi:hypothetical protein